MAQSRRTRKPVYTSLASQVLIGIAAGILLGYFYPATGSAMKPLGDAFIKLIKMIIAPIIFVTVVHGISRMKGMKEIGRIGVRALIYFEVISTLALVIGLIAVMVFQPGVGINADVSKLDAKAMAAYTPGSRSLSAVEFFLDIIPTTIVDAFAKGNILQIMLFSILFGIALLHAGERGRQLVSLIEQLSDAFFGILAAIMKVAPIGAFGAMAFTVGAYGVAALLSLGKLVGSVYVTCAFFVFVVLGLVARIAGFSIWKLLVYIKEEILIVLGTSTSESVLPRIMERLEEVGCQRSVVGLVVPTGYSFNQDGSSIYYALAFFFIAQATNVSLTLGQKLTFFAVLLVTSKGAAGVSGSAFVALAATLSAVHTLPVGGMALLIGVERFMSMARALTNLIGNVVATMVVARWDGALDVAQMRRVLGVEPAALTPEPSRSAQVERT